VTFLKRLSHGIRGNNDEVLRILRSPEPGWASVLRALLIMELLFSWIFVLFLSVNLSNRFKRIDLSDWWPKQPSCVFFASIGLGKEAAWQRRSHRPVLPKEREHAGRSLSIFIIFLVWAEIAASVSLQESREADRVPRTSREGISA